MLLQMPNGQWINPDEVIAVCSCYDEGAVRLFLRGDNESVMVTERLKANKDVNLQRDRVAKEINKAKENSK